MIRTAAVQGYRSLRDLVLPLGPLSVISGANGSGKSSVYRSLRLLAEAAQNRLVSTLAQDGGLGSILWAGPETISRSMRQGVHAVEGLKRREAISLKLGFGGDEYGCNVDLGYPPLASPATMFSLDPRLKRECLWQGAVYRRAAAMVDWRSNFVWLATSRDEEPRMLTQHLRDTDSMPASVADSQRAPEMLAVREGLRVALPRLVPYGCGGGRHGAKAGSAGGQYGYRPVEARSVGPVAGDGGVLERELM